MNKSKNTNYNNPPLMLSVTQVASLGISSCTVRKDGFPSLCIGSRSSIFGFMKEKRIILTIL